MRHPEQSLPLVLPASHMVLVQVLAAPFPVQLSAHGLGKIADDGPADWGPATHVQDLDETPGFSLTGQISL